MEKNVDLLSLFKKKKYSELIYIIEYELPDSQKNLSIINLLGVSRLLQKERTGKDLLLAIENFKTVYSKEKNSEISSKAFRNFVNASADLYDLEKKDYNIEKAFYYFNQALDVFSKQEDYFLNDELTTLSIIRIYKRLADIKKVKYYLGELIKRNNFRHSTICSYIYHNLFFKNWTQEQFLEHSRILERNLPRYADSSLVPIRFNESDKLQVGFLSSDIKTKHSVTYFLKTITDNFDKSKTNINLYFNHKKSQGDNTTEEFKRSVDKAVYIDHLPDEEAINLIREDKNDILIDLMGVTSKSRLSLIKNRVAPVQILWCGYCNTTGIQEMDYILADKNLIFENEKNLYTEKIIYLPKIWNCHSGINLERNFTDSPIKKNDYITFGSFNNFSKINDAVINTWSKIIKSIKNSRLILKTSNLKSQTLLMEKFKKEKVLDSIEFVSYKKNFKDHMNLYKKIDLALDTFPHTGVTTSFEAIWMGVPVLTMKGYNFHSRCGESINKNLDADWLSAENESDYILKAKILSEKSEMLIKFRKSIYDKAITSPLFDAKSFTLDFFKILESIKK